MDSRSATGGLSARCTFSPIGVGNDVGDGWGWLDEDAASVYGDNVARDHGREIAGEE